MDFDEMKIFVFFMWVWIGFVDANVVLIGKNVSLSFDDTEANFAPSIEGSGERGVLYIAEPLDACTSLKYKNIEDSDNAFALIIRGGCTFDDKVRIAQEAGFHAAIVYDNEDRGPLVAMAGNSAGIHIHAVFISKASGKTLKNYAGRGNIELWIIPNIEFSAWSIMAVSFISLIALSAILATCFFVRGQQTRRSQSRSNIQEFHGMSRRLVKAMPSLIFTTALEDNSTSTACAICLEDYKVGEKLRVLPCRHKFHACCVDSWLTAWRTFCPVCKQDANKSTGNPPPSECTPLLSSASSTPFSSFHSTIPTSSVIQIPPSPLQNYRTPLHSPLTNNSAVRSNGIRISRSSADLQNVYRSQRSYASSSLGLPQSSPVNSRFTPSELHQCNASTSYAAGSSSRRQFYLRHCADSGTSLSAMDSSAYSLPDT